MLDQNTFRTRLLSLLDEAVNIDTNGYPTLRYINEDGTQMSRDEKFALATGTVMTSLCSGITTNLKTTGAASTPQSLMSISAAIRWTLSFMTKETLSDIYNQVYEGDEYVSMLYSCFKGVNHTMLVGHILSIGAPMNVVPYDIIEKWSSMAIINLLAFCAARDIAPHL